MIKIEHTGLTDIGLVRKANEDNLGFIESPYAQIFTVCDGMGGHVGGATASKIAVDCILNHLSKSDLNSPNIEINNAIVFANQAIIQAANENPELKHMGTTCTVLVVKSNGIYIGHVGDSRIYLLSNNKLFRITKDHSFVQNLVDAGAITDEAAEHHPRKNELTRALGVKSIVEPTISANPIKPKKGDILMLCSDGLCGLVSDKNMEDIICRANNIELAANQLIQAAKNAGGHDNITVQLAKITESNYNQSEFIDYSPSEKLSSTLIEEPNPINTNKKDSFITNRNKILIPMVISLLGFSAAYYFSTDDVSDSSEKVIVEHKKDNNPKIKNSNDLKTLECDHIENGFLIHKIQKNETYSEIRIKHKEIYKPYNFNSPLTNNGNKLDTSNIKVDEKIKWGLISASPVDNKETIKPLEKKKESQKPSANPKQIKPTENTSTETSTI